METSQDDWITRWARVGGSESRLRAALASARGRKLLNWFEKNSMPPDALAFGLLHLVWPMQTLVADVKKLPLPNRGMRTRGAQQCRKAAQWLRENGLNLDLPGVEAVCTQLDRYSDSLRKNKFSIQTDSARLDHRAVELCLSRHDYAQIQVIAFLRAYFVIEGKTNRLRYDKRRTWEPITDFLILAKLVPPERKSQSVATEWSNLWRREDAKQREIQKRQDEDNTNRISRLPRTLPDTGEARNRPYLGVGSAKYDEEGEVTEMPYEYDKEAEIKYPAAMYTWFHITKLEVDGKPQGEDIYPQIMKKLKSYLVPLAE
jgi:hypothetical protein